MIDVTFARHLGFIVVAVTVNDNRDVHVSVGLFTQRRALNNLLKGMEKFYAEQE